MPSMPMPSNRRRLVVNFGGNLLTILDERLHVGSCLANDLKDAIDVQPPLCFQPSHAEVDVASMTMLLYDECNISLLQLTGNIMTRMKFINFAVYTFKFNSKHNTQLVLKALMVKGIPALRCPDIVVLSNDNRLSVFSESNHYDRPLRTLTLAKEGTSYQSYGLNSGEYFSSFCIKGVHSLDGISLVIMLLVTEIGDTFSLTFTYHKNLPSEFGTLKECELVSPLDCCFCCSVDLIPKTDLIVVITEQNEAIHVATALLDMSVDNKGSYDVTYKLYVVDFVDLASLYQERLHKIDSPCRVFVDNFPDDFSTDLHYIAYFEGDRQFYHVNLPWLATECSAADMLSQRKLVSTQCEAHSIPTCTGSCNYSFEFFKGTWVVYNTKNNVAGFPFKPPSTYTMPISAIPFNENVSNETVDPVQSVKNILTDKSDIRAYFKAMQFLEQRVKSQDIVVDERLRRWNAAKKKETDLQQRIKAIAANLDSCNEKQRAKYARAKSLYRPARSGARSDQLAIEASIGQFRAKMERLKPLLDAAENKLDNLSKMQCVGDSQSTLWQQGCIAQIRSQAKAFGASLRGLEDKVNHIS